MWLWLCMSSYYLQVKSMDVFKDVFKESTQAPTNDQTWCLMLMLRYMI